MRINSETFKKLRNKNGLSQQTLADASGVAKKTIARIESGQGGETRGSTVRELARALHIKEDDIQILAQDPNSHEVQKAELRQSGARRTPVFLDAEAVLAYDLACERYGVEWRLILEGAPVFFTLLAEMSLAERRRRVEDMKAIIPDHLYSNRQEDDIAGEENSIAKRDLFAGLIIGSGVWPNPFCNFLSQKAKDLDPDDDVLAHEDLRWAFDELGFIDSSSDIFKTCRKNLTGGSTRADYALSHGYTRIRQIPKELRGEDEDVTSERVKWLEDKVPDEEWEKYERWLERFNNESPIKGDTEDA